MGRYYRKRVNGDMARPTYRTSSTSTAKHNQVKEQCHERPAPAAPAPGLLMSIFHMSRGKIKKALPSDFEESLSKYCNIVAILRKRKRKPRTWPRPSESSPSFSFFTVPDRTCIDPAGFFYLGIHFPLFQIAIFGTRLSKNVSSKIFDAT